MCVQLKRYCLKYFIDRKFKKGGVVKVISKTRNYFLKIVNRTKIVTNSINYLNLRKKIKPLKDEWVFFWAEHGSGDIYVFCSLSQAFIEKYGGYITVITPEIYSSIPKLFPSISKTITLKRAPSPIIGRIFSDEITENNKDLIRQRIIWGFPNELFVPIAGYKDLRFVDAFKMFLGLDPDAKLASPTISDDLRDRAFKKFRELDLPLGNTVIVAPYTRSSGTLSIDHWVKAIEKIKKSGLHPVTNVGKGEAPLPGTIGISLSFDEILPFSEFAGHVVSIRNGLCDVLSTSGAKLTIIYPQRRFGRISYYEYYSLKLNGLAGQEANIQELVYDQNEDFENWIGQIINFHIES